MRAMFPALMMVAALAAAAPAQTGIPDLGLSYYWWNYAGTEPVTLLVVPDGGGARFDQAAAPDGTPVDATLHLAVIDFQGNPVAGFPYEDMWLEWADGGVRSCVGGTIADLNTDAQGVTHWVNPLEAGGHSVADLQVMLNGTAVIPSGPVPLRANSPDLNGDLHVNLSDVSVFVPLYLGPYAFAADLAHDGVVNLSDVVVLIGALGRQCR